MDALWFCVTRVFPGYGASCAYSSQAQHDPETARQARLAALEGRGVVAGGRGEGGDPGEVATPLLHPSGDDVRALQVREALLELPSQKEGDVFRLVSKKSSFFVYFEV